MAETTASLAGTSYFIAIPEKYILTGPHLCSTFFDYPRMVAAQKNCAVFLRFLMCFINREIIKQTILCPAIVINAFTSGTTSLFYQNLIRRIHPPTGLLCNTDPVNQPARSMLLRFNWYFLDTLLMYGVPWVLSDRLFPLHQEQDILIAPTIIHFLVI
jgi:hypothetical protein